MKTDSEPTAIDRQSIRHFLTDYPAEGMMPRWRREVLFSALTLAIPCLLFFGILNYAKGHNWLGILQMGIVIVLLPCLWSARRKTFVPICKYILLANSAVMFLALLIDGGIDNSGIYWVSAFPFLAFMIAGCKQGLYWVLAFILGILATVAAGNYGFFQLAFDTSQLTYFLASFLVFTMLTFTFALIHEKDALDLQKANSILLDSREQLQRAQMGLEAIVAERTMKLLDANEQLQKEVSEKEQALSDLGLMQKNFMQAQKMEAIGTLVGGIAHDFNNMLSGITANLYMVQRKVDDEDIRKRLGRVDKLVMHAADMIRQMLTFARKDDVTLKQFELRSFLKEAFKLARVSVPAEISTQFAAPPETEFPVNGDATQLQQVIMNLMNNARDALQGIENPAISVELKEFLPDDQFRQKHSHEVADRYAQITVRDNGSGISVEMQNRIFEPFYTTKEVGKGTGLGLAMTYGAVQSHHGIIELESTPGHGTAFHIYLPMISEAEKQEDKPDSALEFHYGNGQTILLVDDDIYLRQSTRELLEEMNYRIIEAGDGSEAVHAFRQHQSEIALTIMDIVMPVMGGVQASQLIRDIKADTHVIFITGYDKGHSLDPSIAGEHSSVIYKPLNFSVLSQTIQSHLNPR